MLFDISLGKVKDILLPFGQWFFAHGYLLNEMLLKLESANYRNRSFVLSITRTLVRCQ